MEHTKRIAVTGVAALMVFGTGAAALAAVPSADGVINGCRSHLLGTIRVIDAEAGEQCNARETVLNWSQTGPQGPAGHDGVDGAAGPAGPTGAQGQREIPASPMPTSPRRPPHRLRSTGSRTFWHWTSRPGPM
jgi:hypothetical protein